MRTKALILSAAIGLVGSASLMAQTNVYSLNAVGYVNITLPGGTWSMVGNQLNTSTSNTIGTLIPNPVTNQTTFAGAYDDLEICKYVSGSFAIANGDAGSYGQNPDGSPNPNNLGWDPPAASGFTLNPGEGAFIHNASANAITLTFVGQVPQGTNTVIMQPGYNIVASPIPQSGGITSVLGLEPTGLQTPNASYVNSQIGGGDQLFLFNVASQSYGAYVEDDYSGNGATLGNGTSAIPWDSEPSPAVGQAFWYAVQANAVPLVWTRVFSVNN